MQHNGGASAPLRTKRCTAPAAEPATGVRVMRRTGAGATWRRIRCRGGRAACAVGARQISKNANDGDMVQPI